MATTIDYDERGRPLISGTQRKMGAAGFGQRVGELGTRAQVAGAHLGRQVGRAGRAAGSFLGQLAELDPYQAGASTREAGISLGQAMHRESPERRQQPSRMTPIIRGAGQFGAGLLGLERGEQGGEPSPAGAGNATAGGRVTAQALGLDEYGGADARMARRGSTTASPDVSAEEFAPTAERAGYPQSQGPLISHGNVADQTGPVGQALQTLNQPEPWEGSKFITGPSGRQVEIPKPGYGWVVGPSGKRMNIGSGQQVAPQQPAQQQGAPAQQPRQAQSFRENLPQRPAAPRFGNVRGGNIFEQAQGFMGQMGRYIDQGGARQAALGAQARRAASIKGWQDWNIKSRQRDTEDWKAKHPDWKQVEPPDAELGGAPPPIMFVNPQDPNQIVTLTPQGAVAHTQEEIQEEHAAAQQWVSEGGDLAAMNEDLVKRGFPPLVGG